MTILDTRPNDSAVVAELSWSSPDTDLWVASRSGDYAGMVEFRDGHFVVQNHLGETIATCSSIPSAQAALEAAAVGAAAPVVARLLSTLVTSAPRPLATRTAKTGYVRSTAVHAS